MGVRGKRGGRCVSVFRKGGVSEKRRDRNPQTADLGRRRAFADGFMGKCLKHENTYPLRLSKEFRWGFQWAAILRRETSSMSGVFENQAWRLWRGLAVPGRRGGRPARVGIPAGHRTGVVGEGVQGAWQLPQGGGTEPAASFVA